MLFAARTITPLASRLRQANAVVESVFTSQVVDGATTQEQVVDSVVAITERFNQRFPTTSTVTVNPLFSIDSISSDVPHSVNGNVITYDGESASQSTVTVAANSGAITSTQEYPVTGFNLPVTSTQTLVSLSETSLSHATQQVNLTPQQSDLIYTTQDHANAVYIRNPNRRVPEADLTSLSPWNSSGVNRRAGIAITPRNILVSNHFQIPTNATVRFVEADGTVHDRTVVNRARIQSDLAIARLDSDLPAGINLAQLPPANFADFFSSFGRERALVFYTDQEEKLHAGAIRSITDSTVDIDQSTFDGREIYFEDVVGGDSGSPYFMLINGQPVVTHVAWTTAENGTSVHANLQAIQDYCGVTGHAATVADFSGFDR